VVENGSAAGETMAHFRSILYGEALTRDQVRALPKFPSTGARHKPIPHIEFVEAFDDALQRQGFVIGREQLTVNGTGAQLYGTLDIFQRGTLPAGVTGEALDDAIDAIVANVDQVMSMGYCKGNDNSLAAKAICGRTVTACTNGVFSGSSVVMRRRQTSRLHLSSEVDAAVSRAIEQQGLLDDQIQRIANIQINDDRAKAMILDSILDNGVCAPRYGRYVYENYFGRGRLKEEKEADLLTRPDCLDRTEWGLHNAMTRAFRDHMKPGPRFVATARLGRYFGLTTETDAEARRASVLAN